MFQQRKMTLWNILNANQISIYDGKAGNEKVT